MQLYNTLTRKKEIFRSLNGKEVKLYGCGPTVYMRAHLGNFRTYIFEDVLRRTLFFNSYKVKHIMNITDVGHLTSDADSGEDKLDKEAKKEGKSPEQIAKFYTDIFLKDSRLLNILPPSKYATATKYIPEMIRLVEKLQAKGCVYETPEVLYFDVSKFNNYGQLARLDLEGQKEGAREEVEKDKNKRNKADFAVWFKLSGKNKNHLQNWDSPWGKGWPGWHLECSAIAMKELGETIDIHCGGIDHIPIHHTNEIAQSESVTGKKFVHFWLHGEFLNLKNARMGKSEGNAITVATLVNKGIDPLVFRYLVLQTHYRSKMIFSWSALTSAEKGLKRLKFYIQERNHESPRPPSQDSGVAGGRITNHGFLNLKSKILNLMNNDLDTPRALSVLHQENNPKLWLEFDKILGLDLDRIRSASWRNESPRPLIASDSVAGGRIKNIQKRLMKEREEARRRGDFKKADAIRIELESKGIKIRDKKLTSS